MSTRASSQDESNPATSSMPSASGPLIEVAVSPTCPWEYLCVAILALNTLRLRGRSPLLRFLLPSGWRARLEQSLYEVYHINQTAGTEFLDNLEEHGKKLEWNSNEAFSIREMQDLTGGGEQLTRLGLRGPEELVHSLGIRDTRTDPELVTLLGNISRLRHWRDQFLGQRAFVIGNGPSLRGVNLRALEGEFTLGSNGLFLLDRLYRFRPTLYVVEDRLVAEDRQQEIAEYQGSVKLFPWDQRSRLLGEAYLPLIRTYEPYPQFSEDISREIFTGWSVTYLLLQLAYYAGAKMVYLVGVDGTYPSEVPKSLGAVVVADTPDMNHFDPEYFGPGRRYHRPERHRVELAYSRARTVFEAAGGGIWNASLGGELDIFPRVKLSNLVPTAVF